ncbi:MAG TPA: NADH-quinone oxidoreductase subunit L, partial [Desulfurella acetivorans]|nr:NADH-quinone oxidoreductase subunit L [Desulfurella acetivorans]
MKTLILLIIIWPLIGFLINGLFGKWTKNYAGVIASSALGLSFLSAVYPMWQVILGNIYDYVYFVWMPFGEINIPFGLRLDSLSTVMLFVVTFVSWMIHIYSNGYMKGDPGYARYFTYLNLFVFSMLLLILGNNYLLMFVGWEGVGLCSYLLIGFWYDKKTASDAGEKAFVVNRIGDAGFIIGVLFILFNFNSVAYADVFPFVHQILTPETATIIGLALFLGAMGKSAQFPLYIWLTDAMEGPTPVSSLIHAATMVTAGVYMVARSNAIYDMSPIAMEVVASVGAFTAFYAATMALTHKDIKRILAYSTLSQLGYMFIGVGVGVYWAGIFHLMTHAFFKGLLFLGAGAVMHSMRGLLSIDLMGGLRKKMPQTVALMVIASLAIAGIPPFAGFFSKDAILAGALEMGHPIIWIVGEITAFMTAFYMFRFVFNVFYGEEKVPNLYHELHTHE